jgi:hypothetical protein
MLLALLDLFHSLIGVVGKFFNSQDEGFYRETPLVED